MVTTHPYSREFSKLLTVFVLLGVVALFAGCEASFKNSDEKIAAMRAPATTTTTTWSPTKTYTNAFDANVSGGGTSGTSASFRVMGANLSSVQKVNGASASFKVRGGIMGQYGQ